MDVIVPREDLDKVEQARVDLIKLLEETLEKNPSLMIGLTEITQTLWYVGNRRYPEAK